MKHMQSVLTTLILGTGLSVIPVTTMAVANGDGACSAAELTNKECAALGTSIVEFLGAYPSTQCLLSNGQTTSCTSYYYRYSGAAANQLNVAIPIRNTQTLKTASDINCSQFYNTGTGDPTTGFGKNQNSLGICRIAYRIAGAVTTPPAVLAGIANFVITVDPSTYDTKNPLDWQLKQASTSWKSKDDDKYSKTFAASIVGPYSSQPEIYESSVSLITPTGQTVSYTNLGGNISVTSDVGRAVPLSGTKLCVVKPNGDPTVPYTSAAFSSNWDCETIIYATDQCDIKTDGNDPCRFIGGTCIKY
jgi:hypothetical protein